MFSVGGIIGGLIAVYLLQLIWEWALFKRVFDDPVKGKLSATLAAWLTAGTLGGLGFANGGPYFWGAFLLYLLPALIIGVFVYTRGLKLRDEIEADRADPSDLTETFS